MNQCIVLSVKQIKIWLAFILKMYALVYFCFSNTLCLGELFSKVPPWNAPEYLSSQTPENLPKTEARFILRFEEKVPNTDAAHSHPLDLPSHPWRWGYLFHLTDEETET